MKVGRLVWRGLDHHRWMHLLVMLGVATTTAVITGALLVGESVRGSLTDLTLDRLGGMDLLLIRDQFFDRQLVDQVRNCPQVDAEVGVQAAEGLCLFSGVTVERRAAGRAGRVVLVGRDADWPQLAPPRPLAADEILLNAALASELGAAVGDEVIVRLPTLREVPAESPLGRKDGFVKSRTGLRVVGILPNQGWGQFQLTANQQTPRNAFVANAFLQDALDQQQKVNAIAVTATSDDRATDAELAARLAAHLRPSAADAGFQVQLVEGTYRATDEMQTAWQYLQITTERMIFSPAAGAAALRAAADTGQQPQPVFTYLANTLAHEGSAEGIPYSTIAAVDPNPVLGPYVLADGSRVPIEPGQIILNQWAARDLKAAVGDRIAVTYFLPETTHGAASERAATFELVGVLPLTEPATPYRRRRDAEFTRPPTWANDPHLTPTVAGVTDQASIDDWDPPFPFDNSRVRPQDDEYWDGYRTTPKALISLADGRRLWRSRFGELTAVRVPVADGETVDTLQRRLAEEVHAAASDFGFEFRTVKADGLAAAQGTTPFEWLFLGFSMFLVFAALMLTAMLVQLSTMLRQAELGIMLATGWSAAAAGRVVMAEMLMVATMGGLWGLAGGVAYAALMLAGLRTWWLAAVVTPFMRLHISPWALLAGLLAGIVISLAVVRWTIRGLRRAAPLELLRRNAGQQRWVQRVARPWAAVVLIGLALACSLAGMALAGEAQAGAFFASGAALLAGLLLLVRGWLRRASRPLQRLALVRVARAAIQRNPGRSLLTMALVAVASFLILAIGAFRLQPSDLGTGGFSLLAASDQPVLVDLNDPRQRRETFDDATATLDGTAIIPLRVRAGEDASCRNLYQTARPRVLGVPSQMAEYFDDSTDSFAWAKAEDAAANPWQLLFAPTEDEAVPVILDKNTAIFSLHLAGKIGEEFTIDDDGPIRFRIVALLSNTVLQGSLLVSEPQFLRRFPDEAGYRQFLISTPPGAVEAVAAVLESRFGDEGLDARDARAELSSLLAVQNTYLSTFQSLGLLGLLLGTLGLAIVQIRNVVERRRELGTMRAIGFGIGRLQRMIALENMLLLGMGLAVGLVAALAALVPHMLFGDAALPTSTLGMMLILVIAVGMVAGVIAGKFVARAPILDALRHDA